MSKVYRRFQETFIFACGIVENFRRADRQSFGGEKSENAINRSIPPVGNKAHCISGKAFWH